MKVDDAKVKVDDAKVKVDDAKVKVDDAKVKVDDAKVKVDDTTQNHLKRIWPSTVQLQLNHEEKRPALKTCNVRNGNPQSL